MLTRNLHQYIHPYRQRNKWKLSDPSSIAGGPQKKKKKKKKKKAKKEIIIIIKL